MGITVYGDEAIKLLELLEKMDKGYVPTEEERAYLERIEAIDIYGTNISTLPESIDVLLNLQELNFAFSKISILQESIGNLSNLKKLFLLDAKITVLPESIGNLSSLQELDLSRTQISTLPESIGNLSNLQTLNLSETQIRALPESIGNLSNLQELYLPDTQISTLPGSIGNLFNLQVLYLSGTQISTLPESIGNLFNLQVLYLSDTQISLMPEFIGNLSRLRKLGLRWLHLQEIPKSIFELGLDFFFGEYFGDTINLKGTTLSTQPISLFHQPRELIQAYYDAPKVTINDAKVIFLGDGGVGKTRTIKRLLNGGEPGDYPTELTPGIEITDYSTTCEGHPVDLRIWDFGGQEIMHAMHRCFLTDRTCYVVMVSNRFGNRTQRARYWLKTIDSFAKDCPVILAVNLWDTDEGIDGVNGELLEQEFKNLKKIITYSAKGSDKDHFNRLTEAIVEQANRLDSCGMEFPESWANIRADLSKRAEKDRYISKAEYLEICEKNGETDPQICGWLLEWFNDLGVCFSYHTDKASGQELEDYQVLNPKWLVNAAYRLINEGGKFAQQGVLNHAGIESILQDYLQNEEGNAPKYTYILEVMRKFRLSYPNNEEGEFIPALCPDQWKKAPQTKDWDSHVTYEMRYKYLPDSVLHQLMIYGKEKRLLEQAWSGGMELRYKMDALSAVVRLDGDAPVLHMEVYAAAGEKPWELLEKLRSELERINKDLNLEAEDVIVIKTDKQTAHFPVKSVLKARDRGKPSTLYAMDGGELEEYRVDEILGAAFDMKKVEEEKKNADKEGRDMQVEGLTKSNPSNPSIEDLLKQVLDHQERVTAQFTDALLEILRESREQPVQKLVAEVEPAPQKKNPLEVTRDLLSDSSNLATVASAVAPHLPTLLELAKGFLSGL